MGLKGESKGIIGVVDVVNDVLYVYFGGLFAFNDLDFSLAPIREVFNKLSLCVYNVSNMCSN